MTAENKMKKKVKIFTKKQRSSKPETEYIQELQASYDEKVDLSKIKSFQDFPLSYKTMKGLKNAGYKVPTEIQKQAIMLALKGNDILGAAQTGSGKTLAFLIPMLEKLFCKQWTNLDGLGALIITPTRELALQIFETLKKIGLHHDFSCGLIIGGKDLKFERKRVDQCNIMICTPGRLLQHMDENPLFNTCSLQVLILDEADRCMDMGFKQTMNAIIANLPLERQTMLFSATQTKSVKDLARLNLKDPSYVAVHANAQHSTPDSLEQSYYVCELHEKVAVLWSFIKTHLKKKCIIFLSTCKQVKFIFDVFSKMRPGVPLLALYSRMHQLKRIKVYEEFSRKNAAVLFATDIVARGLDFPEVHWVVQVDCPEDADTYIHRVGRTAGFFKGGESLLLLMPSELPMLEDLEKKKIPINKVKINPNEIKDPYRRMETFVADDTALQYTAKRAFVTYLKSVFMLKKRRDIFNIDALDLDAFAHSYGLTLTPRLNFMKKAIKRENSIKTEKAVPVNPNKIIFDDDGNPINQNKVTEERKKNEKDTENMSEDDTTDEESDNEMERENNDFGSAYLRKLSKSLKNKDRLVPIGDEIKNIPVPQEDLRLIFEQEIGMKKKPITKVAVVKKMLKEKTVMNKKIKFDEDGDPVGQTKKSGLELCFTADGLLVDKLIEEMKNIDQSCKETHRLKVKAKHRKQKQKLKEQNKKDRDEHDDPEDSGSDEDVDLSWLPDPDKVYGNGNDQGSGEDNSEHSNNEKSDLSEDEEEQMTLKHKKRKRKLEENSTPNKKQKKMDDNEKIMKKKQKIMEQIPDMTVDETEDWALKLLNM